MLALVAVVAACGGGERRAPATPASPPASPPSPPTSPPSSVIEVGPAPEEVPPPPGGSSPLTVDTGIPECDDYLAMFDRLIVECAAQLGPAVDAMKQARDAQAAAFREWRELDPNSLAAARQASAPACKQAQDAMHQAATSMGCALDRGP